MMDRSWMDGYLDSLGEEFRIPARDLMITLDGECVYRHFSGVHDYKGEQPVDGREVYWVYSMTKPLTTCCAMKLTEEGKLSPEDRVCDYLPEFGHVPGLTVRHLLTMCGGFDYDLEIPGLEALGPRGTTREVIALLAKKPLLFEPGTDFCYSLCHDVLAAVMEVASGERFSDLMRRILFDPLGMKDSGFDPTPDQKRRLCAQYRRREDGTGNDPVPAEECRYRLTEAYESGGAGLITTVEDYSRFTTAVVCGKVLRPETLDLWRTSYPVGRPEESFRNFERWGYRYALGVRTMVDTELSSGPKYEFGWDGAAGAYCLMDPEHRLSVVFGMHVLSCGPAYHQVHRGIRDLTYRMLTDAGMI